MISGDPRLPQLSGEEAQEKYVPVSFYRRFQERFYTLWRELAGSVAAPGANSDITSINGLTTPLSVAQGGTGQTSFTNGQLLIGNSTGNTLTKATLTASTGISITNGNGSITIAATGGGGNGDVLGPGSATDNAVVRFDGTSGQLIKNSPVVIDDSGNISSGTWQGTAVAASYGGTGHTSYTAGNILYASNTSTLAKLAGNTTTTKKFLSQTGTGSVANPPGWDVISASDVGLGSVENTALSTWAGSANLLTVGTVTSGTWNGTVIAGQYGGTGVNNAGKTLTISANATISGTNTGDQTITLTGDVTGSGTGSFAATIANNAVTFAKMQTVSANVLLGNDATGTAVQEITCTQAGRDLLDDADAAAQRLTLGLGTLATQNGTFSGSSSGTNTGDQTLNSLLPSQTGNSGKFLTTNGTDASWGAPAGGGTVTSVSVTSANGVSGTVADSTTTPAITLSLGAITPTSVSTGALTATGNTSLDGGTFVFNDSGADKDLRIEGDTDANLVFTDASTDRVGIGTNAPDFKLHVSGQTYSTGGFRATATDKKPIDAKLTVSGGGSFPQGQVGATDALIANQVIVDETNVDATTNILYGLRLKHDIRGSGTVATSGARNAFESVIVLHNTTANRNPETKMYVAVAGKATAEANDNGNGSASPPTWIGNIYGGNFYAELTSSATRFNNATAAEFNTDFATGSSVYYKSGIQITQKGTDKVDGTVDAAISISNVTGAVGWKNGILFSAANSADPMQSTGKLIATADTATVDYGIFFSTYSFGQWAIFAVNEKSTSASHVMYLQSKAANDSGSYILACANSSGDSNLLVDATTDNPVFVRVGGALKQVTQGATDSGGTGYRVLRVGN